MHPDALPSAGVFGLLSWSLAFCVRHGAVIFGLALLAAVGRALQVGRGGRWPKPVYGLAEIAVEAVRLVMVLAIVGFGDPFAGARAVGGLFSGAAFGAAIGRLLGGLKAHGLAALLDLAAFAVLAVLVNLAVFAIARWAPMLAAARRLSSGNADDKSLRLAVVLLLKNLTIIPFTAVWLWGMLLMLSH